MVVAIIFFAVGLATLPDGAWCGSHHETTLYMDTLIRVLLPPQLQNGSLDPYSIPYFEVQSQSDHRITVKGRFRNGRLSGLTGLNRIGQCGGPIVAQGNVTFSCTVGFDKLNATFNTEIKYGILPHSNSIVTANLTRPFGVLEITANARGTSPIVKVFRVSTLGQFDTAIHGGVLKGEFPHIKSEFTHKFLNEVQELLTGPFAAALSRAVSTGPLPSGLVN